MMKISFDVKGVTDVVYMLNIVSNQAATIQREATRRAGEYLKPVLEQTTNHWKHKPKFIISTSTTLDSSSYPYSSQSVTLSTDDDVWNMLNKGTRPHVIAARNPSGRLWFMAGGFVSKTYPSVLFSGPGQRAYYDFRSPQSVNHPGTIARDWSGQVVRGYGDKATQVMKNYCVSEYGRIVRTNGGKWGG